MIDVVVTRKRREAEGIYSFELAAIDRRPLPAFSAGSHIDVHLPNGLVRQYSLCNHPEERHRYLLGVLLDPASRGGSQAMHEQVHEGSRLRISEPRNLFPLEHAAGDSVLFAGGIGITPILCMAERLARIGALFELHYCGRSAERMAFIDYIRHSPFADRVHIHVDDGEDSQRLDTARVLSMPAADRHLYVCGPTGFMEHVLGTAREQGWAEAQLHREYFTAAVPTGEAGGFEVQLASSGRCLQVPADRSVAQVLLEAGIDIPLSCEQGICGTCLTRVLEGEPDHRDMFLTDAERARNDQFTPCCSRARSARLVLDL
ncbi:MULTISPECIES: PDR/VanB family oxidoreductase [unclassified Pseudomonas]|uniref:PDR/VanB family oxidoreductase n=1 Tax=unclassified Pseudomonas TaxID=196821 RepID=UPI000875FFFE|nr:MULTISPECIES: PDR/VanB family oxidoreductase [unclassified Pseudomonas]SCZ21059.1 vanillate O-demethylase ferredoxin subunit [Pseudomonas sp. NFACC44-2]SDA43182.1 vanillate O-demethylase ferredoxin subunit [Pseudomonas sp. NFACC51]SFH11292.1 vanillate O-demethylase ferredoxin subunit [Pseudomonas sp. NFACC54]SFS44766.1 vanillate O-demethylase ferredoxin subunit [Pseudomonas sp. NFACC48-1]